MHPFAIPNTKGVRNRAARRAKAKPRPFPPKVADLPLPAGGHVLGRVVCPYPPAVLNPNARGHWSKRTPVAKAYRRECWALALAAFGVAGAKIALPAGQIALRLDFFPPDRRARDDDNAEAAFKAGRDGIADALKVDDSRFATTRVFHPEARACVAVTVFSDIGLAGEA